MEDSCRSHVAAIATVKISIHWLSVTTRRPAEYKLASIFLRSYDIGFAVRPIPIQAWRYWSIKLKSTHLQKPSSSRGWILSNVVCRLIYIHYMLFHSYLNPGDHEVFLRFPLINVCTDFETSSISGLSVGSSAQHELIKHHSWSVTKGVFGRRGLTPLCTSMMTCASRRR